LPIAHTGTEFQRKVWDQLILIPYGATISYLLLSKALGNVKAIRAVGAANGKNKISIIVPCHRVIGSTGQMVGYGGEIWRKKWLLEHEAKHQHGVRKLF
jgi:methylated-DNA-[protein]-cysteine S-methyltransferase